MMSIHGFGIKDVILLIAGIACVYLAYMWLRLTQVKRRKQKSARVEETQSRQPPAVKLATLADAFDDADEDVEDVVYSKPRTSDAENVRRNGSAELPSGFDRLVSDSQQKVVQTQARELQQLRDEVRALQRTQAEMLDEIDRLKSARNVSPLYNEALNMAQNGLNAEGIAARCGISIAEAELVAALANKSEMAQPADPDEEYHGQAATRYAA